jgi:hypothetical protein
MMDITRCGLDIAKQVFQVHLVNERGAVKGRKTLPRARVLEYFALSGRGTNVGALTHPRNNSGQSWASPVQTLAFGRIGQDGTDMLAREAREIFKDLIFGHPTGEVLEDIGRGDAGSEKRRLPAAHAGGDLNQIPPIHGYLRL